MTAPSGLEVPTTAAAHDGRLQLHRVARQSVQEAYCVCLYLFRLMRHCQRLAQPLPVGAMRKHLESHPGHCKCDSDAISHMTTPHTCDSHLIDAAGRVVPGVPGMLFQLSADTLPMGPDLVSNQQIEATALPLHWTNTSNPIHK